MAIETKQQLIEWLKRQLGYPVIKLELENQHYIDCIDEALLYFSRYSGDITQRKAMVIHLSAGQTECDMPLDVETVQGFDRQSDVGSGIQVLFSPLNQMYNQGYINFFSASFGGGLTTFEMGMQYLEIMHKTLEASFSVEFNKYTHKLKVIPTPQTDMFGVIEVWTKYTPGDTDQSTLYDEWWVRNYALALVKIILGHIWSKYTNMVIPGGATLNGAAMLAEGKEEKKLYEDMIMGVESEPLGFFVE